MSISKSFFARPRPSVDISAVRDWSQTLSGAPDAEQDIGQHVLIETQADPPGQVEQSDESHEIVRVVRVVPGAGVELPQT